MNRPVTREAIERTASGMRQHLAEHGVTVSQQQMVDRATKAQVREDNIRREEGR